MFAIFKLSTRDYIYIEYKVLPPKVIIPFYKCLVQKNSLYLIFFCFCNFRIFKKYLLIFAMSFLLIKTGIV